MNWGGVYRAHSYLLKMAHGISVASSDRSSGGARPPSSNSSKEAEAKSLVVPRGI
jgi:hypothetical protein